MLVNEVPKNTNEVFPLQTKQIQEESARSPTKEKRLFEVPDSFIGEKQYLYKKKEVQKVVNTVQEILDRLNVRLVFSIHKETGEVVVKVVDPKTNQVIRQIPPEELLKLREKLDELLGILFDARA